MRSRRSALLRAVRLFVPLVFLAISGNAQAQNEHYVLVEGLLNEGTPGQFYTIIRYMKDHGVKADHIHSLHPHSQFYFTKSSAVIGHKILEIATESVEGLDNAQMVLVGHSRGALEVMMFALTHPEFIRDHVKAIILMQGPFGGSRVADYLLGLAGNIDSSVSLSTKVQFQILSFLGSGLAPFIRDGLYSLTTDFAASFWPAALYLNRDAVPVISPKVKYIVAAQKPGKEVSPVLRSPSWYLQKSVGANDGLVALADQTLNGVGRIVGEYNADHADLVLPNPLSNGDPRGREEVARLILLSGQDFN